MALYAYKLVSTHAHDIWVWKILSRLIHVRASHIGWMNGDVKSNLFTMELKNGEQLEYFHIRIIILQEEIILCGENVSPTRFIFQYMMSFSDNDKLRAFIVPRKTDLIIFLVKNVKLVVYTGGNIHGFYCYLEIIGSPTRFTTSFQSSHNFGPSYWTNIDT